MRATTSRAASRLTFLILVLASSPVSIAHAQWAPGGVPVAVGPENQKFPAVVSDGNGGAIIAWQDLHLGVSHIFAQRLDSNGVPQWAPNGVLVTNANFPQAAVAAIPDGHGGAFLVYEEYVGMMANIFAQRIDPSGTPLWGAGIPICQAAGDQRTPVIISDGNTGNAGFYVCWTDSRVTDGSIYAQAVNFNGTTRWVTDGFPVTASVHRQGSPCMVTDGSAENHGEPKGVIIGWVGIDGPEYNLYAQRITAEGNRLWGSEGLALCLAPRNQFGPAVVNSGAGIATFAWYDSRSSFSFDIYAQRAGPTATTLWATNGVPVSVANNDQLGLAGVPDGSFGAIFAWIDVRTPGEGLYLQRLDANGAPQWTIDGVSASDASFVNDFPKLIPDFAGGAIVTWADSTGDSQDLFAQRFDASGNRQWGLNGVTLCNTPMSAQFSQAMVSDGAGGAIVSWTDDRSAVVNKLDVYANRVSSSGVLVGIEPERTVTFELDRPFPNPTSGGTRLSFSLPAPTRVYAQVFDLSGRSVRVLSAGEPFTAGRHDLVWNGRGAAGEREPDGVYFVRAHIDGAVATRRVLVLH